MLFEKYIYECLFVVPKITNLNLEINLIYRKFIFSDLTHVLLTMLLLPRLLPATRFSRLEQTLHLNRPYDEAARVRAMRVIHMTRFLSHLDFTGE